MTTPSPGQDPQLPPAGWTPPPAGPQPGDHPGRPQPWGYPGQPHQGGYPNPPGGYPYPPGGYPYPPGGWAPPPPPTRGRNALVLGGSLLAVLLLVGGMFALFGPGSGGSPSTASPVTPTGTATGDAGGSVSVAVAIGGCVHLGGTFQNATVVTEDCGSTESNYKVVGKAPDEAQCVGDADASYYETERFGGSQAGALCLDVDWQEGDCFTLPTTDDGDPARVDCAEASPGDVQVRQTLQGTTDQSGCPEGGVVYDTRDFVVCLAAPRTS